VKAFALRKHTTVSGLLRLSCKAIATYQHAEFYLEEKKKQETQVQKLKDNCWRKIPKREVQRAIEFKQKEAFDYATAAIHLELEDEEKSRVSVMMGQDISPSGTDIC